MSVDSEQLKKVNKHKLLFLTASIVVFIFSLTQTAITYTDYDGEKTFHSIELFLMGSTAILGGGLFEWIIWLANPLYVMAMIMMFEKNKKFMAFSISSVFLSSLFMLWNEILVAENGRHAAIKSLDLGYWFWLFSHVILLVGTVQYYSAIKKLNAR